MTDDYPSRVAGRVELLERPDPAVWCDLANPPAGPLTNQQLTNFERDGYVFVPGVLSPSEVERFRAELIRMANDEGVRSLDETVLEEDGRMVRSIYRVHLLSDTFRALAKDERVAGAARQILDGDIYVHQSRVNLKRALDGRGASWHSDFETWHVEDGMPRPRAVSASVALTESNEFNGPVMVIPGSHKQFVACAEENGRWSGTLDVVSMERLIAASSIQAPKGAAGGVLFLDCNTMHGSVENLSPYPRSDAFFVYNSVDNAIGDPFGGREPRPEFAAERTFTSVHEL